jgi:ATP-dependent RNA helicase DeaD
MGQTFTDLGLGAEVLCAIDTLGYEEPTPIQSQTIPLMLAGRDVLAQAQTGTGKTAAFAVPIIERTEIAHREVQTLVLAPTRELAVQVAEAMRALGLTRGLEVLPIYGGQGYDRQLRGLRAGVHVVVGTPGRIMDHIRRGTLDLSTVTTVVLDEADEMLAMGFVEDIEFILDQVPTKPQVALFSATIPPHIEALARRYQPDAERVSIAQETRTAPQTRQLYVETPQRGKVEALTRILDLESPALTMIFCRTKRGVDELAGTLQARGYSVAAVHGDVNQAQRERLLQAFRESRTELLIATDVAARGLDIPDVTHVFNYDMPDDADAYVHRIGRTGRMGRAGEAITFVTPRESRLLRTIERQIQKKLKPLRLPSAADVAARRRETFREALCETMAAGTEEHYALLVEELAEEHDPAAIAAAAMQLAVDASRARRDASTSIAAPPPEAPPRDEEMTRLFLDAGRRQGVRPKDVVGSFTNGAEIPGSAIGSINVFDDFAFVEVASKAAQIVLDRAGELSLRGRQVNVTTARPRRQ